MKIKSWRYVELNTSIATGYKYTNFKCDLIESKSLICNKNCQIKFDEKLKERLFKTQNFLTMITIDFVYYYENVFILTDIWMIGKN